jgi:hypothetical protein
MEQDLRAKAQRRVEAGENAALKAEPPVHKEWGELEQAGAVVGTKAAVKVEAPEEMTDRAVEIESRWSGSLKYSTFP